MKDFYSELKEKAKNHSKLYYYTDYDTLTYIVKNKSLQLTRLDKLNDQYENKCISRLWATKVFVTCFTHKNCESFFFWNTYAAKQGLEKGVCIEFSKNIFNSINLFSDSECNVYKFKVNNKKVNNKSDPNYKSYTNFEDWGYYDISVCDIKYVKNDNKDHQKYKDDKSYAAIIKTNEWKDEEETRIRVALKPRAREFKLEENKFKYPYPPFEKIYLKLDPDVIKECKIILNPWSSDCFQRKIIKLMISNGMKEEQLKWSTMRGNVKK